VRAACAPAGATRPCVFRPPTPTRLTRLRPQALYRHLVLAEGGRGGRVRPGQRHVSSLGQVRGAGVLRATSCECSGSDAPLRAAPRGQGAKSRLLGPVDPSSTRWAFRHRLGRPLRSRPCLSLCRCRHPAGCGYQVCCQCLCVCERNRAFRVGGSGRWLSHRVLYRAESKRRRASVQIFRKQQEDQANNLPQREEAAAAHDAVGVSKARATSRSVTSRTSSLHPHEQRIDDVAVEA